ncbi:nucleoside triphosphate pyrophosphatase [uncultured Cocleimonas sp.]|uniref:Maf family protein n=1 Tax=uncultured Cocleimonas sp. TaxID=1051587 RepID=UPI00261FD0E8|nr:Maf family nucleotide pyrophosphatase [uncultured Cocleimonas sp.]
MPDIQQKHLILGSTSAFRKELLERLRLDFTTDSPDIDETPLQNETPEDYVIRLSLEKAKAVAARHDDALIIASDQCSVLNGKIRGKPGNHLNAVQQLTESSGNRVSFLTGLCLYDCSDQSYQLEMVPFHVDFRDLSAREIESYLQVEQPYGCAGSFKSEGLGVTLFKRLEGDDPSSLIGLPLIKLSEMLRLKGYHLP